MHASTHVHPGARALHPTGLLQPSSKVLLIASAAEEVVAVRTAKELDLPSFEHELRRAALRRGRGRGIAGHPLAPPRGAAC